jgi:hypothetical protein
LTGNSSTYTTTRPQLHLHQWQPPPATATPTPPPGHSSTGKTRIYIPVPKAAIAAFGKVRAMFLRETHPFLTVIYCNRLIIILLRKNRLQKIIKTTTFFTKTLKKKPQKLSLGVNMLMFFLTF